MKPIGQHCVCAVSDLIWVVFTPSLLGTFRYLCCPSDLPSTMAEDVVVDPAVATPAGGSSAGSAQSLVGSRWRIGDVLVRIVLPLFIASGALAKVLYGSPYELPQFILYYSRAVFGLGELHTFLIIVATELCLALTLVLQRRWSFPLARMILIGFIAVLLLQWLDSARRGGPSSCGCFGAASPPIGIMLAFEGVMLILTFALPRRRGNPEIGSTRYFVLWILCVLAILSSFSTQRFGLIGVLRPDADMVEVELLQDAKGRRFADLRIAKYLDKQPADLPNSEQYWVLYRLSCPFCHELFKARFNVRDPGKTTVAVEIPLFPLPPSKEASDDPLGLIYEPIVCAGCERATLPGGREWKIQTPLVIHVKDGVVVGVDRAAN